MDTKLRQLQLIELDILKEFVRICDKYTLRYYIVGGTLLGAVRHRGFIPWDDDISVLRQSGLLLLQRVDPGGHVLPHEQRQDLHQGQRAQIPVSVLQKRADAHQLLPDSMRLFRLLRSGQHHLHLEADLPSVPHRLSGAVQHRRGLGPVGPVCLLPGHSISVVCLHPAADVHVRHLLHH